MRCYVLTTSLYEKLLSRGMYLVCRRCGMPIHPSETKDLATGRRVSTKIVSKPSKYRQWQCIYCKYRFGKYRPKDIFKCPKCGTEGAERTTSTGKRKMEPIIKDVGRKFYCSECFQSTFITVDEGIISAGMVMLFGL